MGLELLDRFLFSVGLELASRTGAGIHRCPPDIAWSPTCSHHASLADIDGSLMTLRPAISYPSCFPNTLELLEEAERIVLGVDKVKRTNLSQRRKWSSEA